jgi:uncharacterized membrane protein
MACQPSYTAQRAASIALGFGFGGLIDGIVGHQILGWHHMVSGWVPTATPHGIFHLGCLAIVIIAVYLVRRYGATGSTPQFSGSLLAGWGLFNLIEGTVDHLILRVHHVRPGPHAAIFDISFLVMGAILLVVGIYLSRPGARRLPTKAV